MTQYGPFTEVASNGQKGWLSDDYRPIPEHLRRMLGLLDGEREYTYSIWRGADPGNIVGFREPAGDSFMQAAGSPLGITVEVRLKGADGVSRLFTVGRPEDAEGVTVPIPISADRVVRVRRNEVFTAEEASRLFYAYFLTETVPEGYVLRELDLSERLSEER